jgi:hypothetical protein
MNELLLKELVSSQFKLGLTSSDVRTKLRTYEIDEKITDKLIQEYLLNLKQSQDDFIIDKESQIDDWYTGPIESEKSHWKLLTNILRTEKQWSNEMVEDLNSSSSAVVSKLLNPKMAITAGEKHDVKGLVLGYVQSGKTANYSAVISKALDAGYKFIIVLSGIHNNLRYQTECRLRKEIIGPSETKSDPITRMDENGDFDGKHASSSNRVLGSADGFGMAVLKKNSTVLRKFNNWISEARPEVLEKCKVLIIDDEADQASINTAKKPNESTTINKLIKEMINKFSSCSYVGYTATPFANIFIDATIEKELFPKDFIISLKKPISYVGTEELFGHLKDNGEETAGFPVIRLTNKYDLAEFEDQDDELTQLPPSLKIAINTFLVASAIRIARGHHQRHISMLIHCTHLNSDQSEYKDLVYKYIDDLRFELRTVKILPDHLQQLFDTDFKLTTEIMGEKVDQISKHDLFKNILSFIESIQIVLDNSLSDSRLSFKEKFWGIVIGGNTLSRGLTIEGLTVSYFIRSSKAYDTLMQMGRWFGYRPGYLDLTRIFISEQTYSRFNQLATVEKEIREEIKLMSENGDRPFDLRLKIRQLPGMKITALNKMKTASTESYSYSGAIVQSRFLASDVKVNQKNKDHVLDLIQALEKIPESKKQSHFDNFRKSLLYLNNSKEIVQDFLDNFQAGNSNLKKHISNYILMNSNIKYFNIAVMSQIEKGESFQSNAENEIFLVNRTSSQHVKNEEEISSIYIKNIIVPRDELIDLGHLIQNAPKDADKIFNLEGKKGINYYRSKYRPKDTALMLIYPINTNSLFKNWEENDNRQISLKKIDVAFGLAFVFPKEEGPVKSISKYIVNSTVNKDSSSINPESKSIENKINSDVLTDLLKDVQSGRAISIRQPYVEEILIGKKLYEYRNRSTKIRGRVFLYASNTLGDTANCKKYQIDPEALEFGVILGSVEIIDCEYLEKESCYGYKLKNPIRYQEGIKPENHPQPCFFFPFNSEES